MQACFRLASRACGACPSARQLTCFPYVHFVHVTSVPDGWASSTLGDLAHRGGQCHAEPSTEVLSKSSDQSLAPMKCRREAKVRDEILPLPLPKGSIPVCVCCIAPPG